MTTWILGGMRTPMGRLGGGLAEVRPDDLLAEVFTALGKRNVWLDPASIDDVFAGDANGAGEDNRNVARMAVLLAGWPASVPAVTVNRLCGSGLEAVVGAHRAIATGDASIAVAGGVESMSRAPWIIPKPERAYPHADATAYSSTLGWRMVNPRLDSTWTVSLGQGAEIAAERFGITRQAQDAFARRSHERAHAAWRRGDFDDEVVPVDGADLAVDENVRDADGLRGLDALRPAFVETGTVTAGNASPLSDGAAAMLLADDATVMRHDLQPLARIVATGVVGVEPHLFSIGPVGAANRALERAGLRWDDIDAVELNEAFASQALACLAQWPDLDPDCVNPVGGAIALGHPLGCSGTRILVTLVHQLQRTGGRYGLATLCIGVGQGLAVIVEATE